MKKVLAIRYLDGTTRDEKGYFVGNFFIYHAQHYWRIAHKGGTAVKLNFKLKRDAVDFLSYLDCADFDFMVRLPEALADILNARFAEAVKKFRSMRELSAY